MCGIAGILLAKHDGRDERSPEILHYLKKMTDAIAHRGPDGEGADRKSVV